MGISAGCSQTPTEPVAAQQDAVVRASEGSHGPEVTAANTNSRFTESTGAAPSLPDLPEVARTETGTPRFKEVDEAFEQLFSPGLESSDWDRKLQAIVDAGAKAMPTLRAELNSTDVVRREQASTVLVLMGPSAEEAVPEMIEALKDTSSFVRANAAAALASFPGELAKARNVLIELLDSPEPELRRLAASNLIFLGESAADLVPRLALALDDSDSEVVRPIAQLLGQIGPAASEALPRLQRIAFEAEGEVKAAAEQAVLQIEGRPALEVP
jgi:HEAT repeat protein